MNEWWIRHELQGKELEDNRAYNNRRDIHCEWIHPDRFRYHHEMIDDGELRKFSCGGKYDPMDVSDCVICQGHKYNRTFEEVLEVTNGVFGYPNTYSREQVIQGWQMGVPAQKLPPGFYQ